MSYTMIVSLVIPDDDNPSSVPKAQVIWPLGHVQNLTLWDHDWSNDTWNWRGGRLPDSMLRWLRSVDVRLHGERLVYSSPADVGTGTNEAGRLMVYEVDYEVV